MFRFSEQKERKKERKQKGRTLSDTMYKVAFLRLLFLNNSKRHSFAHRQGLQLLIERVSSLETTRKGVTDSRGLWIVGRGLPGWYLIYAIFDTREDTCGWTPIQVLIPPTGLTWVTSRLFFPCKTVLNFWNLYLQIFKNALLFALNDKVEKCDGDIKKTRKLGLTLKFAANLAFVPRVPSRIEGQSFLVNNIK